MEDSELNDTNALVGAVGGAENELQNCESSEGSSSDKFGSQGHQSPNTDILRELTSEFLEKYREMDKADLNPTLEPLENAMVLNMAYQLLFNNYALQLENLREDNLTKQKILRTICS
jgi:hypothetical protein